jgi:hypothetical protein
MFARDLISRFLPRRDPNLGAEFMGQSADGHDECTYACVTCNEPLKIITHSINMQYQWHSRFLLRSATVSDMKYITGTTFVKVIQSS